MGLDDHEGGTGTGVAKTGEGIGNWAQSLWATRRQESHGFLFETDFELRFRYVSPAVGEICGFEPEELAGQKVEMYLNDRESVFTL